MKKVIYLLRIRSFIFLVVLFSFFDNLGMKREDSGRQYDYLIKTILVGDAGVGKTQIFNRLQRDSFDDFYISTIGANFWIKNIEYNSEKFHVELWDSSGQENYLSLTKKHIKEKDIFFFVYDISDKNSFDNIKNWVKMARKSNNEAKFLLVGNKKDLKDQRQIKSEEAKKYAEENSMKFIEVSAKTKEGIDFNLFFSYFPEVIVRVKKKKSKINLNKIGMLEVGLKNEFVLKSFCERLCDCD